MKKIFLLILFLSFTLSGCTLLDRFSSKPISIEVDENQPSNISDSDNDLQNLQQKDAELAESDYRIASLYNTTTGISGKVILSRSVNSYFVAGVFYGMDRPSEYTAWIYDVDDNFYKKMPALKQDYENPSFEFTSDENLSKYDEIILSQEKTINAGSEPANVIVNGKFRSQ